MRRKSLALNRALTFARGSAFLLCPLVAIASMTVSAIPARADDNAPAAVQDGGGVSSGVNNGGVNGGSSNTPDAGGAEAGGGARVTPGGPMADPVMIVRQARKIVGELALSADQQQQVDAIFDKADADARAMLPSLQGLGRAARVAKVRAFVLDVRQQLAGVLTPDQMTELATRTRAGIAASGPAARIRKLKEVLGTLGLDDQQKTEADAAVADAVSNYKELIQERQQGQDVQSDIQEVGKDLREKLRSILTPDQMQTLRAAMQNTGEAGRGDAAPAKAPADVPAPEQSPDAPASTQPNG